MKPRWVPRRFFSAAMTSRCSGFISGTTMGTSSVQRWAELLDTTGHSRSEERRVGKESRTRSAADDEEYNNRRVTIEPAQTGEEQATDEHMKRAERARA